VTDIVKARLDETMQEENEKKLRKNNVIVFGLSEESSAAEAEVFISSSLFANGYLFFVVKITIRASREILRITVHGICGLKLVQIEP